MLPEKDLESANSFLFIFLNAISFARDPLGDTKGDLSHNLSCFGSSSLYQTGRSSKNAFCKSTVHSPVQKEKTCCKTLKKKKKFFLGYKPKKMDSLSAQ